MPVFWNLDAIHRNQLIIAALLLMLCPWPFITLFYVILLAYSINEWEEEKIGVTLEDHLDLYLTAFGYTHKLVTEILAEQDKFIRVDIQGGLTDYEVKHSKTILKDLMQEMQSDLSVSAFYEWWNEWFEGITKERYEILMQAIDFARDEWDTMIPIRVPANDMVIESLDYWYGYLVLRNKGRIVKELGQRRKLFAHVKASAFSKWYIQARLDYWLHAMPLLKSHSFFDLMEEHLLEAERRKLEPHKQSRHGYGGNLTKEDRESFETLDISYEVE